jgi:hypothetical protein
MPLSALIPVLFTNVTCLPARYSVQVMERTLDHIQETYGTVEEYLSQGGMSPGEIEQLRAVLKPGGAVKQ